MTRLRPQVSNLRLVLLAGALIALLGLAAAAVGRAATEGEASLTVLNEGTHASGVVAGAGESLWFVGYRSGGESVLGRVDSGGGVREFPLGPSGGPGGGIVDASDDSFWFTVAGTGKVGRVDPGGGIEQFALGAASAGPGTIVAGPGNEMWFVEEAADRVGRVDAAGDVDEFPLPPGARPTGIAAGPDGGLWIAEKGLAKIARMGPNGAITASYSLPDRDSLPHAIVVGPDDALWFSDESGARIGRITTAGVVEDFPIPGDNGTRELVVGGDGNLWFTTGYAIGSISPSGQAGEPACVSSACDLPVTALARGPDEGVWFSTGYRMLKSGSGEIPALSESGYVGRFLPPATRVRLGKRATRVDDGLTTIAISCHGGAASDSCRGQLRLSAKLGGRRVTLDSHRYRLEPATSRRLPLLLGTRGKRALARGKRLSVQITASMFDGSGARRNFVLQARGRR